MLGADFSPSPAATTCATMGCVLEALAAADAVRAEALVIERRRSLPPPFRAEIIAACSEPTALHELQHAIIEYLAGRRVEVEIAGGSPGNRSII